MSYTVTIEFKESYLHAKVTGRNTLNNVLGYLNDIHSACLRHQTNKVLIEENLLGPHLDAFEMFEVIAKNVARARRINLHLAYVDTNEEHNIQTLKFAENLARMQKIHMQLFPDTTSARQWLLDEQ